VAQQSDIVVIGAGIIGLSIARQLCLSGCSVAVLEQSQAGREASWAAAGMLAPHSEFDEANPYFELCRAGLDCYPNFIETLQEETGVSIAYNRTGVLFPALTDRGQSQLEDRYKRHYIRGLPVRALSAREARRLEPNLSNNVQMALSYPADHQVENRDLLLALTKSVQIHGGVIHEGVTVQNISLDGNQVCGVRTTKGEWKTSTVVNAMGCRARYLEGVIPQYRIPIHPVRGQILSLGTGTRLPFRHTIYTDDIYLVPRKSGRLIIGATVEKVGFRNEVTVAGIMYLLNGALKLAPGLKTCNLQATWSGLRPATNDGWPVLGATETPGLYISSGHGRNGILLAPITAKLMTEVILYDRVHSIMESFLPTRFSSLRTGLTSD